MSSNQQWRWGITIVLIVLAGIALWPTVRLWTMSPAEKEKLQLNGELLSLQQDAIRLGLDLQGGLHTVLRVKLEEIPAEARADAVDQAMLVLRNRMDGLGVGELIIQKQGADRIVVDLPGFTDKDRAEELIGQTAALKFKLLDGIASANAILASMDTVIYEIESGRKLTDTTRPASTSLDTSIADTTTDLLAQMMKDTAKKTDGTDTFAFNDAEVDAALSTTPLTSLLELSLGNRSTNTSWPGFTVRERDRARIDRWLAMPQVRALIPGDIEILWSTRASTRTTGVKSYELYVVKKKEEFPGRYLEDVALGQGQAGGLVVNFELSGRGADIFSRLTRTNKDKPLAIVIDDKVESAPFINSEIRNRGQITMGTGASAEDARNMQIVLKAGALPAPIEIIEKNVVGASLGADSIEKGLWASIIGLSLMLLYVAFYYKLSGVIADIGLLLNLFFLMAALALFGATLTLPGIAGMILSIGMAIDSNVLIFERIREELRAGKSVRSAIDAGYDRAFSAILDSHVTTMITAGALFLFGSGPVKGFAVTLFAGVAISLYTAYVITRVIFDSRKAYQTLSI